MVFKPPDWDSRSLNKVWETVTDQHFSHVGAKDKLFGPDIPTIKPDLHSSFEFIILS